MGYTCRVCALCIHIAASSITLFSYQQQTAYMNNKQLRKYLLSRPEAYEDYPFGPDTTVYKVKNLMFALTYQEKKYLHINLKCEPREAIQLRDVFKSVLPGYHMNKSHWNTIILDGDVPDFELERMIDNSYRLVVKKLKVSERLGLELRNNLP